MEQLECHRRVRADELSLLSHPCPRSCGFCCVSAPRVYIYPDEEFERGSRKLPPLPLRFANGSRVAPHSFLADQGLLKVIHDNLQPMLTSQPSRADVFFAFITPYGPPYHEYTPSDHAEMDAMGSPNMSYIPNYMRLRLKRQCAVVHEPNLEWTRRLTHLTPANARRHFVLAETPPELCHLEPEFRSRRIPSQMARLLLQLDVDNLHSRSTRRKLQVALARGAQPASCDESTSTLCTPHPPQQPPHLPSPLPTDTVRLQHSMVACPRNVGSASSMATAAHSYRAPVARGIHWVAQRAAAVDLRAHAARGAMPKTSWV